MDLTGKHIVITGASSGIGRAASIQASKLGAHVTLIARNEEKLNETVSLMSGDMHNIVPADLTEIDKIDGLIADISERFGAIDGLVHCAGLGLNRPIKLAKPEFVEQVTRLNYFAFVELIRAAASRKRSNNGASYIGISSVAAVHGNKTQGVYSASKGAMNSIVHSFAKELAAREIRVNTIAFGMVDTDMYKGFLESGGNNEELLQDQYLGIIPPEYAGNAICFLLSDAGKYITGSTFNYDAGDLS
jgi:NAD(P)-dependent dehydrogenase (short-subunit alcohol dehydrogenase family)